MPDTSSAGEWIARFIQALEDCKQEDAARLAMLRRGLGKDFWPERDMWVARHLPDRISEREWRWAALVASLFAWHPPQAGPALPFAKAMRRLFDRRQQAPSIELRFLSLLKASIDDLPHRLRQAVGLLRSEEIDLDWKRLLNDLRHWQYPKQRVQRRWCHEFWAPVSPAERPQLESDKSL